MTSRLRTGATGLVRPRRWGRERLVSCSRSAHHTREAGFSTDKVQIAEDFVFRCLNQLILRDRRIKGKCALTTFFLF